MPHSIHKLFILKFLCFYLGCVLCYELQRLLGVTPVMASVLVGFSGTLFAFPPELEKSQLQSMIYAGSFAGMCSASHLPGHDHIFWISFLGTTIYFILKPHFTGFGGKLGVVALLSVFVMIFMKSLL